MLERLVQALERREPAREERERDAWKIRSQLRQMGIVDYYGDFNPEAADEWLNKLQQEYDMLQLTNIERLLHVGPFLREGAASWSGAIRRPMELQ